MNEEQKSRIAEATMVIHAAYRERAQAYYEAEKYKESIADWTQLLRMDPDNADTYFARGLAYNDSYSELLTKEPFEKQEDAAKMRLERAVKDFSKAIRLNPEHAGAYFVRANIYRYMGRDKEAIRDFTKTLILYPDNDDASAWLAYLLENSGDENTEIGRKKTDKRQKRNLIKQETAEDWSFFPPFSSLEDMLERVIIVDESDKVTKEVKTKKDRKK